MLQASKRLRRLWYFMLVISFVCLSADITFSSYGYSYFESRRDDSLPLSLIPDILTSLLIGYNLWARVSPSTSTSSLWFLRLHPVFTIVLAGFWVRNSVINAMNYELPRMMKAGVDALMAVLVAVEMLASRRVSIEQRRLQHHEIELQLERELDLQQRRRLEECHGEGAAAEKSDTGERSVRVEKPLDDTRVHIVRPDVVDLSAVLYSQQALHETYRAQFEQQYQDYVRYQHRQYPGKTDIANPYDSSVEIGDSMDGKLDEDAMVQQEGKLDDPALLLESSYKFEVPPGTLISAPGATSSPTTPSPAATSIPPGPLHSPSAPTIPEWTEQ